MAHSPFSCVGDYDVAVGQVFLRDAVLNEVSALDEVGEDDGVVFLGVGDDDVFHGVTSFLFIGLL